MCASYHRWPVESATHVRIALFVCVPNSGSGDKVYQWKCLRRIVSVCRVRYTRQYLLIIETAFNIKQCKSLQRFSYNISNFCKHPLKCEIAPLQSDVCGLLNIPPKFMSARYNVQDVNLITGSNACIETD